METAIRRAIEGGYKDMSFELGFARTPQSNAVILLDPLFWQALGKAEGWGDEHTRFEWHRFVDHLIAGKDIDSFFNDLLK